MSALRGFVDLQVNGYLGHSFSSPTLGEEEAAAALRGLIADGTAVLLPTVCTAAPATYERILPLLAQVAASPEFAAHVPGFHLEGPFMSPREGFSGVHNPAWMQPGDPAVLDRMHALCGGRIRLLTIAPEITGAMALIRHARSLGITVSLGHHASGDDLVAAAAEAGATSITHLGNGLPHQIDRHRNPLIAGLAEDRLSAGLIGDGHHLPWSLLKVMLRAKGLERCYLVSDASSLAGLPPGEYGRGLGGTSVIAPDGRLYNKQSGYLAGSSSTVRQVVNATRQALGLGDAQLRQLAVDNPLRLVGLQVPGGIAELPRASDGSFLAG